MYKTKLIFPSFDLIEIATDDNKRAITRRYFWDFDSISFNFIDLLANEQARSAFRNEDKSFRAAKKFSKWRMGLGAESVPNAGAAQRGIATSRDLPKEGLCDVAYYSEV